MELKTLGCPYSQGLKLGTIHHPHTDHRDNKAQGNLHLCVLANLIFTMWRLAQSSETTRFCKLLRGTTTWGSVYPKSHWVSPLFLECRRRKGWKKHHSWSAVNRTQRQDSGFLVCTTRFVQQTVLVFPCATKGLWLNALMSLVHKEERGASSSGAVVPPHSDSSN